MSPDIQQDDDTRHALETAMQMTWDFDYEVGLPKLRNLYAKAKRGQWDAERDVDWSLNVDPSRPIVDETRLVYDQLPIIRGMSKTRREEFRAHVSTHMLSQFLHGEQGALMTAAALTQAVPDHEGKLYAATQTMDEARHVEVFEKYVRRLGILYPMSPTLKPLIDSTVAADSWVKIAIGMNMIVEGLALGAFHNMRRNTRCELLRQITTSVLRDESRHVAFGNVYVGRAIAEMHPDDREDVAQFAFDAIKSLADVQGGARGKGRPARDPGFLSVLKRVGIAPRDFLTELSEIGGAGMGGKLQPGQIHSLKDLMMPALVRVGAVTERSRELYAAADIPVWEDVSYLEALEHGSTGEVGVAATAS